MWVVFALVAMALTSLLPICNKRLLRDTPPALVAWAINGASIPLLAGGMLLYTQCSLQDFPHTALSCTLSLPQIDPVFVAALLGAAAFNWGATLLSTHALDRADASLVTPLLTFNPAFTVLVAWIVLGETPGLREGLGIVVILLGVYLLEVQDARTGLLAPLFILGSRSGALMAILASGLWGTTTVLEKLAIEHVTPPNGPLVALISTALTVLLLTPNAMFALSRSSRTASQGGDTRTEERDWGTESTATHVSRGSHHRRDRSTFRVHGDCSGFRWICECALQAQRRLYDCVGMAVAWRRTSSRTDAWRKRDGSRWCA